jgi:type IV pilus assembly protein PilY1
MRTRIFITLLLTFCLVCAMATIGDRADATMTNYCQSPSFLNTTVSPNIFFVVDGSGSMSWAAYSYGDSDSNNDGLLDDYDSEKAYEGYFTPEAYYVLNGSGVYVQNSSSTGCTCACSQYTCYSSQRDNTCVKGASPCSKSKWRCCSKSRCSGPTCDNLSGNYLNYENMSRMDVLRWAMTGGSPSTCSSSNSTPQYCDPERYTTYTSAGQVGSVCSDSLPINDTGTITGGCTLKTTGGIYVNVPWARINAGLAFVFKDFDPLPRMGGFFFGGTSVKSAGKVYLGDYTSSGLGSANSTYPYQNLISAINAIEPTGSTPTGPAMTDALNYFQQTSPQHGGMAVQTSAGVDQWKNPMYTYDSSSAAYALTNCAKNFVMLLSDGQWNQPSCYADNDPARPAYTMHNTFTNSITNLSTSVTAVYTLGLFLQAGVHGGDLAMKNVAMYGSFNRGSGTWPSGTTGYPASSCNDLVDCGSGSGSGSSCTLLPAVSSSHSDWDKNIDGVPDTYFAASSALGIKDAIFTAVLDAIRKVSSGTAVSRLASSEGSGATLIQAVFYPNKVFDSQKEISWISELHNLWYYVDPYSAASSIREDTSPSSPPVLNLQTDRIAKAVYIDGNPKYEIYADADGNGVADSSMPTGTVAIDSLASVWKAGTLLWQRDYNDRVVYSTTDGSTRIPFNDTYAGTFKDYLMASSNAEAANIINYVLGLDRNDTASPPVYRDRTVGIGGSSARVWKLGDIISSTPRMAASSPLNNYHSTYGDSTYSLFIHSNYYKDRGMVYVGANDGMFHAFNLGKLEQKWSGQGQYDIARVTGADLGKEAWAYIPKHALPYLIYLTDEEYCHLFYVNLSPVVADVSINTPIYSGSDTTKTCYPETTPSCASSDYAECPRQTCVSSTNALNSTSWKTVVIGGMGLGGACRMPTSADTGVVKAPTTDPADVTGTTPLGLSSYFALDVTDQNNPVPLWEFANPALGFSTSGPAIIRVGDKDKNGKWFAVFASGPTGPISGYQFYGASTQNLKIFIVDLKTGALLRTIDTGITNAFAGPLFFGAIDTDRGYKSAGGFYQHDAVYFGYTAKNTSTGEWTKGGVIRLLTGESANPATWTASKVIEDIGPVSSAIAKLQDRTNGKLWLFFGSGRYHYKSDDLSTQRALYGLTDPCYVYSAVSQSYVLNSSCTTPVTVAQLQNQTSSITTDISSKRGWVIDLATASGSAKAERVVADPIADANGTVIFATYSPDSDICSSAGTSYLWVMYYNNGGYIFGSALNDSVLSQQSTGALIETSLTGFGSNRKSPPVGGTGAGFIGGLGKMEKPISKQLTPGSTGGQSPYLHLKER